MANFLDRTGLEIVWARIKAKFIAQPTAADVEAGNIAVFTKTTSGNSTVVGVADSGFTIATSVPSGAIFTDEHTTKEGHYTPSGETYTPTANNTNLDWEDAVITEIAKDSKGHVVSVTTTKLPANPVDPNTVTSGDTLAADKIVLGNGNKTLKTTSYKLGAATFEGTPAATTVATEAGVVAYVTGAVAGLSGAMHFRGNVNALPEDTTGYEAGDVIIVSSTHKEYVTDGTSWIELGDESSYALANNVVNSWQGTGDSYITVVPTSATNGAVTATIQHNTVTRGAYSQKGTALKVPQITTDAAGHVTLIDEVNIDFSSAVFNGKLKLLGSEIDAVATDSGFSANSNSDVTISFAKTGDSIDSITTSGGTVTINGVDSLKNPNALSVTTGTFSGTAGALSNGYDGSDAKTLTFDSTTAAAPANFQTPGRIQFTVTTDGHIKGEYLLPSNAFEDTYVTSFFATGGDGTGTQGDTVLVTLGRNQGSVPGYIPAATSAASGVMTSSQVTKLEGIDAGATADGALTESEIIAACPY